MLTQLDRSGALEGVAGLAFGRFLTPDPADEEEANRILEEFAGQLAVPAIADLPFGHVDHNCTLPVGGVALLDADSGTLTLTEPVVRSV
jgi:muramoyltetrapeptide carboxypeptidase